MSISGSTKTSANEQKNEASDETILALYHRVKHNSMSHQRLVNSKEFENFIDSIQKPSTEDARKYIDLLKLANLVMQIPEKNFAIYHFAIDELLTMVEAFETISKKADENKMAKYIAFNSHEVTKLTAVIDVLINQPAFNLLELEVSRQHFKTIIDYRQEKVKNKLSAKMQNIIGNTYLYQQINYIFKSDATSFDYIGAVEHSIRMLKLIANSIDRFSSKPDFQNDLFVYLTGPTILHHPELGCIDRIGVFIQKIFDKNFTDHNKLLALLKLTNCISSQFKNSLVTCNEFDKTVYEFIDQYKKNQISLDLFNQQCIDLSAQLSHFMQQSENKLPTSYREWLVPFNRCAEDLISIDRKFLTEMKDHQGEKNVHFYELRTGYYELQILEAQASRRNQMLKNFHNDSKTEFTNILENKSNISAAQFTDILAHVNNLENWPPQIESLTSLTTIFTNLPYPTLSSTRKWLSGAAIITGFACLILGFTLSPFTAFTSAHLGYLTASALITAGTILAVGTAASIWNAKRHTGFAATLGMFIDSYKEKTQDLAAPGQAATVGRQRGRA